MILGASVCMNGVGTICGDRSGWTRWVEVCLVHGVLAGKRYRYRGSETHCVFVGYCFCFCSWIVVFCPEGSYTSGVFRFILMRLSCQNKKK